MGITALGTKISITLSGTGSGTVSSANIPVYTSPVFVLDPISCPSPGPCLNYDTQNSVENEFGPWLFTLIATPDPGSYFFGWEVTPNCSIPFSGFMCPATSVNATEVFTFANSDSNYTFTARFEPCNPITLQDSGPFSIFLNELIDPITLVPLGGTAPYTFSIDPNWDACPGGLCPGATLPAGLNLGSNSGIIYGTPTSGSPCTYVPIVITDANQCVSVVCIQIVVSERPLPPCYELTYCPTGVEPAPIIVTNDLSQYVAPNTVIQILGECFTVTVAQSCVGAVTLSNPVITVFTDCCNCNPPTCYELEDCSLQNPLLTYSYLAPGPGVNLGQYVGQVVKICEFSGSLILPIGPQVVHTCPPFPPASLGFITQITGSTTGFYYDSSSGLVLPYAIVSPPTIPYAVGMGGCFIPQVGLPSIPSTVTAAPAYSIQYFLGATPITNVIPYDIYMSMSFLQYLIDANTLDPKISIVLNSVPTGLEAQFYTNYNVDDTTFSGVIYTNSTAPQTVSVSLSGSCICYNVREIGACCPPVPVFTGIIDSAWPDCVCCDPPLAPEPPPYEPTIPEIDKKTYFIRESQCDIDANKTFANAMYDIFKTEAYGMESCCPRNFNQIWIQKELSDLSKINC